MNRMKASLRPTMMSVLVAGLSLSIGACGLVKKEQDPVVADQTQSLEAVEPFFGEWQLAPQANIELEEIDRQALRIDNQGVIHHEFPLKSMQRGPFIRERSGVFYLVPANYSVEEFDIDTYYPQTLNLAYDTVKLSDDGKTYQVLSNKNGREPRVKRTYVRLPEKGIETLIAKRQAVIDETLAHVQGVWSVQGLNRTTSFRGVTHDEDLNGLDFAIESLEFFPVEEQEEVTGRTREVGKLIVTFAGGETIEADYNMFGTRAIRLNFTRKTDARTMIDNHFPLQGERFLTANLTVKEEHLELYMYGRYPMVNDAETRYESEVTLEKALPEEEAEEPEAGEPEAGADAVIGGRYFDEI